MEPRSSECVMDFPAAWDYVRATKEKDHHPQCSWVVTHGALLCDCSVLSREYDRRAIMADIAAQRKST